MAIYKLNNFAVHELVPPETYEKFGNRAIRYIDQRLIATLNAIRDYVNTPMTINNYKFGGDRIGSGLRLPGSKYHSMYSAHSHGMAFDAVGNFDYDQIRQDIMDKEDELLPHPVRLEMDINWLHVDVMNETDKFVVTFNP